MSETALTPSDAMPAKSRLPWFVAETPEYYDDAADTSFSWEGWVVDEERRCGGHSKRRFVGQV